MNKFVSNIITALILIFAQGLFFNNINFLGSINPFVYVFFIAYFPLKNNRTFFIFCAFIYGLIIDKTTSNFSRFISVLNTNFLLNAKFKNSNYFGILSWDGININKVQLKDIPKQANVSIGDTIVTGGNSLIFPKGIPIGYVDSYKLDNSQNYLELEIQLATDMANIEKIYVLKNNNLSEINSLDE